MRRLEALAMAIAHEHDALEPSTEAFRMLNPGLVTQGRETRAFTSFQAGWQGLISNLEAKCSGAIKAQGNKMELNGDSSLHDLVKTFRFIQPRKIVELLRDALEDNAITEHTKLNFFIEESNGRNGSGT